MSGENHHDDILDILEEAIFEHPAIIEADQIAIGLRGVDVAIGAKTLTIAVGDTRYVVSVKSS